MKLSPDAIELINKGSVVVTVSAGVHFPQGIEVPENLVTELQQYFQAIQLPAQEEAAAAVTCLIQSDGIEVAPASQFRYQA